MTLKNAFEDLALDSSVQAIDATLQAGIAVDTGLDQPLTDAQLRASAVPVSGTFWQATQPVNGTVTANVGITNGLALDATLTSGNQRTKITDGTNNTSVVQIGTQVTSSNYGVVTNAVIHGLTTGGGGGYVDVKVTPSGALVTDTTVSGTVAVSAASLPLPTGAATSANQSTANASLSSIDGKLPTLDGGYVPVTLKNASVEISNDSGNAIPVSGTFWQATQPVSGTITANIGTTNGVALDTTVNSLLKPADTLAAVTTVGSVTNTVVIKADTAGNQANALKVDGSAVTQPVSFTRLSSGTDSVTIVPSGTQTVSGTVTANAGSGTFAISAATLPLPTGAATSALQTTGNTSLGNIETKISQFVDNGYGEASSTNNTITPLNAGATYTGTGEQNNFPDVFVSCKADQDGTLFFDFSNDNTNWDVFPPSGFTVTAGVHEAHKAMKGGRYFRARFINTSGSNQTYFRLFTYYGDFDQLNSPLTFTPAADSDALTTKSVLVGQTDGGDFKFVGTDPEGALRIHVTDHTSPFGELIVAQLTPVIQADFVYGINANFFSSSLTGSGTATSTGRMGVASTTAATNSSASIQTLRRAKYRPGQGLVCRFTAQFTTGAANSTQLAGMRNANIDGWFIGYNGTSFGIMYRINGVDTWVSQSNFNLDKLDGTGTSGVTIDPTKINIFQLGIGYLGVRGCSFSIQHPDTKNWIAFHDYSFMNATADQSQSVNPTMTFGIQAINTTNNTNIVVKSSSVGVFIVGMRQRIGSTYGVNNFKSVSTTETNLLTVRNNTTINGVTNQSQIRIRSLSVASAASVPVVFKLIKNTTLGGTPSYTNIDATNSCAAFDIAGTTVTGGNTQFNTVVGSTENVFVDLTEFDIFLAPGDTLTCSSAAISGAATNHVVAINWNEDI